MPKRIEVLGTLVFFTLALLGSAVSGAEDSPSGSNPPSASYRKTVAELLELIGAGATGEQVAYSVAQDTLTAIAATGTPVTEQVQQIVVDESLKEFGTAFGSIDYLADLYTPLYAAQLEESELKELLAFYRSPLGKKTLTALPNIAQAAMMKLQQDSFARVPDFQLKVDARLRAAGLVVTP